MSAQRGRGSRSGWIKGGVAVALVLVGLLYGTASWFVYDTVGKAPRACWPSDQANTPARFSVPQDVDPTLATAYPLPTPVDVTFTSRDAQIPNARLAAWWIPGARADAPAVIIIHGVQSCRREASVLLAAGMLHKHGFSVFLMDLRDHGDSQGDDARFAGGSEEYLDVLGGWDWVRAQGVPAERIGIEGFSFGSITAIVAGSREPLVAGVWSDSSATTMNEGIGDFLASQLHDSTGISKVLVPGTILWAKLIAGDDLARYDPITEVAAYHGRHIAFTHGANDVVLPSTMAGALHGAAATAGAITTDAWIVPGAGHTAGIYVDPAGYEQRLAVFFTDALGSPEAVTAP
ncbi:MAG: CocE/NonD family hydrolase [Chloroflexota bacterium]